MRSIKQSAMQRGIEEGDVELIDPEQEAANMPDNVKSSYDGFLYPCNT
jgi:hypothetical protein